MFLLLAMLACEEVPPEPAGRDVVSPKRPTTEPDPTVEPEFPEDPPGTDTDTDVGPAKPADGTGLLVPPPGIDLESSWCWFVAPMDYDLGLFVVGMDSGAIVERGRYGTVEPSFYTGGLAFDGYDKLVMAGYDGNTFEWYQLDLTLGTVEGGGPGSAGYEVAITMLGGQLLVVEDLYPDFDALLAGTPSGSVPSMGHDSRYQVHDTTYYSSGHATSSVLLSDTVTGDTFDTIYLQNYDTWVWGIGIAGDFLHLIDDGRGLPGQTEPRIARFDSDGVNVSNVTVEGGGWSNRPSGLWCDGP